MMKLSAVAEDLVKAFEDFEIVDAHEHLPPEKVYVKQLVDALTLFSHYVRYDLITAGMSSEDFDRTQNRDIPLEERWRIFRPYLESVRHGSYARAAFIAAKEFYGFDDIDDGNYRALSERMADLNKPGIFDQVLRKRCKIRTALTQNDYGLDNRTDYDHDLLMLLMLLDTYAAVNSKKAIEVRATVFDEAVGDGGVRGSIHGDGRAGERVLADVEGGHRQIPARGQQERDLMSNMSLRANRSLVKIPL